MRYTNLFGKTLRQAPAEAESISHQLLIRGGMIAQVATGVYSYLPLGWNVLRKIESIIREEMNKAGGQEIMLPVLHPIEIWEKSGRVAAFGQSLFRLIDRKEHSLVLGPTHEEVITDLVSKHVQSYRDLPILLYQIQTKFRDEPRPRGGLLRVREFIMKDLYSFDIDEQGLDDSYKKMIKAYQNIYSRLNIPVIMIEADSGAIGGKDSHEFMVLTDTGEDEILFCQECGYAANREKAQFSKNGSVTNESQLVLEKIATPEMKTIEAVATFLNVPTDHTIKAVFYMADSEFIFVLIRGDLEINEIKLKNILKCNELRLATAEEVQEAGIVAGFASPVGLSNIRTVADDSILIGNNFVAGANEVGYHYKNVNYGRDFQVDLINDFALANTGSCCPKCQNIMSTAYGIEVGHIFKLGKFMSEKMGAYFLNSNGANESITMGCYGIGLGRLLAAVIERSHDDKGIIWPFTIAPYQVYFCALSLNQAEIATASEDLYNKLIEAGITVLFDDREESAGIKFNDADLMGMPIRLTISKRTLKQNSVEFKLRPEKNSQLIPLEKAISFIQEIIAEQSAS